MSLKEQVNELLNKLMSCETSQECLLIANDLGGLIKTNGITLLHTHGILSALVSASTNKKSGLEREGGLLGIAGIAQQVGRGVEPYLLPLLPMIFDSFADKGQSVRDAADLAATAILALVHPMIVSDLIPVLLETSGKSKWQTKLAALDHLVKISSKAPQVVGEMLPDIIPAVTECMHEIKPEVSNAAIKTMTDLCKVVGNPDIEPHIGILVECMAHPDKVTSTIQKLASTTFVAEVTSPALALMVPLLIRALNDRSQSVLRFTTIIAENLFKLVRNPADAGQFKPQLLPGLDRIIETASFPEIRALASTARKTLIEAAGDSNSTDNQDSIKAGLPSTPTDVIVKMKQIAFEHLKLFLVSFSDPSLDRTGGLIFKLIQQESFELQAWSELVLPYLEAAIPNTDAQALLHAIHSHYNGIYEKLQKEEEALDDDTEGELLCNCHFSLAYGARMLLNHTRLKLRRGQRYGLCGHNGAGKSTLMRAISLGKVEGFPPLEQVRTVFVEHSLQGEEADLSVVDFVAADPRLKSVSKNDIAKTLADVGFTQDRREQPVGTLSGGWKMKLELARAMLMKADVLLLDEPTNHLDVDNIKWLEDYLNSQTNVTSVIVSHDSTFLDNVCTYIIHYEKKKLVYYKGNLSKFVERRPEAKSYYTLAATSVKFSFPPPAILLGVRSNTKAILKMSGATFTYPGAPKPSLKNVSVQLSLASRVAVVGPNGAGKSTMIKLLTGELIPQEGVVWKHPNLRIGYVAQHAFHHLEQHLEKTPNEYLQWRYQGGQDREILQKATRQMNAEDLAQMDKLVEVKGDKRKIEELLGRQKLKKSFQYEVKWVGFVHKYNTWMPRDDLLALGFQKLVQAFDDMEASREGQGYRELIPSIIRSHFEEVGLPGDIADHNAISGLSGGQKVKVVLAAAMWNNPHMLVLDEPTNYLDREALGGLAVAIRDWAGAVIMISHNTEFVGALCPEIWNVSAGELTHQGKAAIIEEHFEDAEAKISKMTAKSASKKKKLTRNELKAREARRRARHQKWLIEGGTKEPDTESD